MRKETRATSIQPAARRRVYERDHGRCVLCGAVEALQCAHFIPRSRGGLGREKNLVMLCPGCHRLYDHTAKRKYIRSELREYLQSKYPDWDEEDLIYKKYSE